MLELYNTLALLGARLGSLTRLTSLTSLLRTRLRTTAGTTAGTGLLRYRLLASSFTSSKRLGAAMRAGLLRAGTRARARSLLLTLTPTGATLLSGTPGCCDG